MPEASSTKKRPPWLRALGREDHPAVVTVQGGDYRLETAFKHDSWAATGLYRNDDGTRIICKFGRTSSLVGIPMAWVGGALGRREASFLRRLKDVELVPDDLGPVLVGGRLASNANARRYVEGEPFRGDSIVDEAFFRDLRAVIDQVHAHAIAYVDLHKRENIIIDTGGRPHLIDFQVCAAVGSRWPWNGRFARYLVRKLQEMDDYHYRKHYARCLPHLLTPEELERFTRPPALVRWHRKVAVPLRGLRRRLLARLSVRDRTGMAQSEVDVEDALRPRGTGKDAS
ncbi:MAG: hypothetical protein AB7I79_12555 [Rhizobiaceae bacterium]